ncbi:MAG: family 16 glycosylhydrolase [Muribaculaceae bacterium]|nr:family 16 glycosylhydrolase [Muribaculaceae bacterium]
MNTKLITWIFSIAVCLPIMACGDSSKDNPVPSVTNVTATATPEMLATGPEAATLELTVKANADWAIRTDADWVTIRPSGGIKDSDIKVQVSVTANSGMDERNASLNIVSGGKTVKTVALIQSYVTQATPSTKSLTLGGQESSTSFTVTANADWTLTTQAAWITLSPAKGGKGDTTVEVTATANDSDTNREATVTLECGTDKTDIKVRQLSDAVNAPDGYALVWSDEFNAGPVPSSDWTIENWAPGHVNNELQTYTSKEVDGKRTLEVKDGFLYINCFKGKDGKIYSGRMNARPNTGWLYGYFEARINLPKGKGTWPAFWMMPSNVDWTKNPWPYCGEIDIMEEVGANPNYVSSSLHTGNYNHTKGTQKTHEMYCAGAEGEFHVYACEWTEEEIITYVDGKVQLRATKASMGADHDSWPFHYAFYPILNLAWGGDWGGYKGVDENALPVSMIVDYVRIFQKK